jgi:hypothetical protein
MREGRHSRTHSWPLHSIRLVVPSEHSCQCSRLAFRRPFSGTSARAQYLHQVKTACNQILSNSSVILSLDGTHWQQLKETHKEEELRVLHPATLPRQRNPSYILYRNSGGLQGISVPIRVAVRSEAWIVFARSNAGTVDSNPTRGMDVCVR